MFDCCFDHSLRMLIELKNLSRRILSVFFQVLVEKKYSGSSSNRTELKKQRYLGNITLVCVKKFVLESYCFVWRDSISLIEE